MVFGNGVATFLAQHSVEHRGNLSSQKALVPGLRDLVEPFENEILSLSLSTKRFVCDYPVPCLLEGLPNCFPRDGRPRLIQGRAIVVE